MSSLRAPAVAGTFYDADPESLAAAVDRYVAQARVGASAPKAIIAPHAGFVYSGPIAGSAYATLRGQAASIKRVLLLGPAHRVALDGVAVPSVAGFVTPLGIVPIDDDARARALALPGVAVDDAAHRDEHSLEVHLPFLQRLLPEFSVLPMVVGRTHRNAVADLLDALWGGPETLIVVSSDLSHYEDLGTAARHDRHTAEKILTGLAADIGPYDACGCYPVRGLLEAARRHHLSPTLLDLRSSGDTAGPQDRVVGYGAFAFHGPQTAATEPDHEQALLDVAVTAVHDALHAGVRRVPDLDSLHPMLRRPAATFVTLEDDDQTLLGCIGSLDVERPIAIDVAHHAMAAAFDDPRMPPITAAEYERMTLHVSVLSPLEPLAAASYDALAGVIEPGVGLLVESGVHKATFLPAVWDKIDDADQFLALLWRKAGLSLGAWPEGIRVRHYTTETFESVGPRAPVGAPSGRG